MSGLLPKNRQHGRRSSENWCFPGVSTRGIPVAVFDAMSPLAIALEARFEDVCRSELRRLQRKTASLSAAERAEIDAISVMVARAIAAHVAHGLGADAPPEVAHIISQLFKISPTVERPTGVDPQTV